MDRHLAIRNTHENVGVINGESDAWDLDGNKISIDENLVAKEMAKLQSEHDSLKYQRDRASAYPSIVDQLDKIYHSGIDEWKKDIKAVKDKFPKP